MKIIFSTVSSFVVLLIIQLWVFDRMEGPVFDIYFLKVSKEYIPLYALTFGALASLIGLWVFDDVIDTSNDLRWFDRVPSPWVDISDAKVSQKTKWKALVVILIVFLPVLANIHFWNRIHEWQAWNNCDKMSSKVDIWSYPHSSVSGQCDFWDAYRYGKYDSRTQENHGGTSFVPLFEPIFALILTCSLVIYSISITRKVFFKKNTAPTKSYPGNSI